MRTTCSSRFLLLPILGLLASQLHADDWPQFRGPYRNGVSDEKLTLLSGGLRQIWEASVGDGTDFRQRGPHTTRQEDQTVQAATCQMAATVWAVPSP